MVKVEFSLSMVSLQGRKRSKQSLEESNLEMNQSDTHSANSTLFYQQTLTPTEMCMFYSNPI